MQPTYSEAELEAAVEALTDSDRFREAEELVAAAAPSLQRVLAEAMASGGWFEDAHQNALRDAAGHEDAERRLRDLKTVLAEENRVAMMIGVAVGWTLADELAPQPPNESNEPQES